jgi:hypothetical protein
MGTEKPIPVPLSITNHTETGLGSKPRKIMLKNIHYL